MSTTFASLNGRLVPENEATVSVFDRGFLYGDALFETMRVFNGRVFRWREHLERLQAGLDKLRVTLPWTTGDLERLAAELLAANQSRDGILRLQVSRGPGTRGYSPQGASSPNLLITLHPPSPIELGRPPAWRLKTASFPLPDFGPLAACKTCSKLPHVLARAEAETLGADEAIFCDPSGNVLEATAGNLFWIEGDAVCTPPLVHGVLPGITRALMPGLCHDLGLIMIEAVCSSAFLSHKDGVFITLSTIGLAEAVSLDGLPLRRSSWVKELHLAYWELVRQECQ